MPPDQLAHTGLLFNGDFETKPSGALFDWKLEQADGAFVDIAPRPNSPDKNALSVEFGQGRVNFGGVWEMVILSPGAYRLTGSYEGNVTGRRGMQWSVLCLGGSAIGESEMILGTFPEERQFEFDFKVPPTGCEVQTVRLDSRRPLFLRAIGHGAHMLRRSLDPEKMTASPRRGNLSRDRIPPVAFERAPLGDFGRGAGAELEVPPVHALDECEQRLYWDKIER